MTDQPSEEGRPIGPQPPPERPPLEPMAAALAAWNACIDLVGAAVAASERRRGEDPSPAEAERWLATLEAIVETLETVLAHTHMAGVTADELIVARRALKRGRESWAIYKAHLAKLEEDRKQ